MKLFLLVALTMTAFAGNSVLNRIAIDTFAMEPIMFAVLRVASGVVTLHAMIRWRATPKLYWRVPAYFAGAVALAIYMIGFSVAYVSLDAGLGALILFGVLQIVMFAWALIEGQSVPKRRWIGAVAACAGLIILLFPGGADVPSTPGGVIAMIIAACGWAGYTLLGRSADDALGATAVSFTYCLPLMLITLAFVGGSPVTPGGVVLAVLAGAVTSGLGYTLWYHLLPQLQTVTAAIAQLSVPVIAVAVGVSFLGEALSLRMLISGMLVLGGIAYSLRPAPQK
jgi:drug/metabolite transporter (DMT)-like permease